MRTARRRVEADFSGGEITSNGGALLLRQADRLLGLTASVAGRLSDARQRGKVEHGFAAMLRQRVFALALGYEDVNDHATLRFDPALQTASPNLMFRVFSYITALTRRNLGPLLPIDFMQIRKYNVF